MTPDFTVEEVAEICRVGVDTVRRWIRLNQLPASRLPGGAYRITGSQKDSPAVDRYSHDGPRIGGHGGLCHEGRRGGLFGQTVFSK